MSIKKSARPLLKVKTASSSHASSPNLSLDTKTNSSDTLEEKSDEDMTDFVSSRPLSVAIPRNSGFTSSGPFCPRRPNLGEILANNSPPPWTLSAFMAYLSQNHCLETLEFTMDASRYRKHYNKMAGRSYGGELAAGTKEGDYVLSLWHKLLEAYIVPNGPREVNIPSEVRDNLISYSHVEIPPDPSVLDIAVQKVYELMEESVLVPFLNSFYPQTALPDSGENTSQEDLSYPSRSYDDRSMHRRSNRRERRSSPTMPSSMPMSASPLNHNRSSAPSSFSQFARTISHSTRHASSSSKLSQPPSARNSSSAVLSPWSSNGSEPMVITQHDMAVGYPEEHLSTSPPSFGEMMTPPNTPPQCDYPSPTSGGFSGSRKNESGWMKLRSSFTLKSKKKSGSFREEELDGNGNFM